MEGDKNLNGNRKGKLILDYLPCVNYAMMCNGISTCIQCVVVNEDTEDWRQVKVAVTGQDILSSEVLLDHVPQGKRLQVKNLRIEPELQELVNITDTFFHYCKRGR